MALFPVFFEPMRCYEPNPVIGPAEGTDDCEHCRRLLTNLGVYRDPAPPEVRT